METVRAYDHAEQAEIVEVADWYEAFAQMGNNTPGYYIQIHSGDRLWVYPDGSYRVCGRS